MTTDPTVAAGLSFFVVGLGQIYNGELKRGIVLHTLFWISILLAILFFWLFVPLFFPLAVWAYGVVDAKRTADEIRRGGYRAHR